jgi:predicted O-methyltransferase YrrM
MVRNVKPEYALECGSGKSTFIIAQAMSKNGNAKKLVTMEESEEC